MHLRKVGLYAFADGSLEFGLGIYLLSYLLNASSKGFGESVQIRKFGNSSMTTELMYRSHMLLSGTEEAVSMRDR